MESTNTVWEYTEKAGGYAGLRFISLYGDEKVGDERCDNSRAIAVDVSNEDAQRLCDKSNTAGRMDSAAVEESMKTKDPVVARKIIQMEAANAAFVLRQRRGSA